MKYNCNLFFFHNNVFHCLSFEAGIEVISSYQWLLTTKDSQLNTHDNPIPLSAQHFHLNKQALR